MNSFKKIIIAIISLLLIIFIALIYFYNKDDYNLNTREKTYLQSISNDKIDIETISDYPIYKSVNSELLKYFNLKTKLNFLETSYSKDASPSKNSYRFRILGISENLSNKDLLIMKDSYVALSKQYTKINTIKDFSSKVVGVLNKDLNDITYYLTRASNITYKGFDTSEELFKSLNEGKVDFVIVPKIKYLNNIIQNKYSINYNFHEFSSKLVLTLSENDNKLNEIFKKIFKTFMNEKFQDNLNQSTLEYYKQIANVSDKDISSLTSKTYTYGYVENAPYEIKSKEKIKGINSEILNNFSKITGIDIKYVKYNTVDELKKAIQDKKVDIFFNYYNISSSDYRQIDNNFITEYVILSPDDSNEVVNSIESLKGKDVYFVKDRDIYNDFKAVQSNFHFVDNVTDIVKAAKNKFIVVDKEEYNYYKNTVFRNHSMIYQDYLVKDRTFMVKSSEKLLFDVLNYTVNNASYYDNRNIGVSLLKLDLFKNRTFSEIYLIVILIIFSPFVIIYVFRKVKSKSKMKKQLLKEERHKYMDYLTSLKNRNYLSFNISSWNELEVFPKAVIVIDLNNIKYINDKYGHLEGDKEIRKAASILINTQLENSEIIRIDGNEFLIYLMEYNERQIEIYSKKLKRELKKLPHSFGASIGYSVINSEVKSIEDAINEASIMMRKDKKNEKEN
ncbi:MAG: GGDEF domain-containing protein [Clostridiales bacterium]|nr:GGDEF domain-containing protein [Clostridiales bacterium]